VARNPAGRDLGGSRAAVFEEDLSPLFLVIVETIQTLDADTFDDLATSRRDVADIQLATNPATTPDLTDSVHPQRGPERQRFAATFNQPCETDVGVGDDFGSEFFPGFGILASEGDLGLASDQGQETEELGLMLVGELTLRWFGLCDHGRPPIGKAAQRGGRVKNTDRLATREAGQRKRPGDRQPKLLRTGPEMGPVAPFGKVARGTTFF
jgi:hypothetical protein